MQEARPHVGRVKVTMSERQWELYRLSVAETMPDSPFKTAVVTGILHKLKSLDQMEAVVFEAEALPRKRVA